MGFTSYFKLQQKPTDKTDELPSTLSGIHTPSNRTPWTSRPNSFITGGTGEETNDSRCELMVSWLHQQQMEKIWSGSDAIDEGVVLKKAKGDYACCPESLHNEPEGFRRAVELLNVRVRLHYIWRRSKPCH
jgi:hypothetical protein